jgi:RimJ/RimL family protein N-acetyltransferase
VRIETERLILRPWEERDRAPYAEFNADPEVRRFYDHVCDRAEVDGMIDRFIQRLAEDGFHWLAVERKADGKFIGDVGLARFAEPTRDAIPGRPEVEIGWLLGKSFWGRGYAPEAARACLDFAWRELNLDEVVAITYRGNHPSRRVMEKLGMRHDPERDFEHPEVPVGHVLRPHVLYAIERPR